MNCKGFVSRQSVWFAIAVSIFDLLLGLVIFITGSLIGLPGDLLELVTLLATTALPLVFIGWMGWWRDAGFVSIVRNAGTLAVPLIVDLLTLIFFGIVAMGGRQRVPHSPWLIS